MALTQGRLSPYAWGSCRRNLHILCAALPCLITKASFTGRISTFLCKVFPMGICGRKKKKWGKEGGEFLPPWLLSDSRAQIWKLTSSKETSISQSLPTPSQATGCLLKTLAYSSSNLETNIHFLVLSPGNQHLNIVLCNISNSQSDFSKSKIFFSSFPHLLCFQHFSCSSHGFFKFLEGVIFLASGHLPTFCSGSLCIIIPPVYPFQIPLFFLHFLIYLLPPPCSGLNLSVVPQKNPLWLSSWKRIISVDPYHRVMHYKHSFSCSL